MGRQPDSAVVTEPAQSDILAAPPYEPWRDRMAAAAAVLEEIPSNRLELRRRLKQELDFDARGETQVAISSIPDLRDARVDALTRRLFSVHVVAAEAMRTFWSGLPLQTAIAEPGRIGVLWLLEALEQADLEVLEMQARVDRDHREQIRQLRSALILPAEPMQAAIVLIPQFERIIAAAAEDTLATAMDGLSEDDIAMLCAATDPACVPHLTEDRALIDGIALRELIEKDLRDLEEMDEEPDDLMSRLFCNRVAYRQVSQRMQAGFASLMQSGLREAADHNSYAQKILFASYLKMARVLSGSRTADNPQGNDASDSAAIERLRAKIDDAERAAEVIRKERELQDETVLEATRHIAKETKSAADNAYVPLLPDSDPEAERRRRNFMLGLAGTLCGVAILTNVLLHEQANRTPPLPIDSLNTVMPVNFLLPIGEMMYFEVSGWLWNSMSPVEREEKVAGIAEIANRRGFELVYIVDEARRELAVWSKEEGGRISEIESDSEKPSGSGEP